MRNRPGESILEDKSWRIRLSSSGNEGIFGAITLATWAYFSIAWNSYFLAKTPQRKRIKLIKHEHNGYIWQSELHWIHWWITTTGQRSWLPWELSNQKCCFCSTEKFCGKHLNLTEKQNKNKLISLDTMLLLISLLKWQKSSRGEGKQEEAKERAECQKQVPWVSTASSLSASSLSSLSNFAEFKMEQQLPESHLRCQKHARLLP